MVLLAIFLSIIALGANAFTYWERAETRRKCSFADFYELADAVNSLNAKRKSELARERAQLRRDAEASRDQHSNTPALVSTDASARDSLGGIVKRNRVAQG